MRNRVHRASDNERLSKMRVDPITFEILRHRLWSINEEGANTLERVSGSLIASEVHDMNTSLMTAVGDSLVIARATPAGTHGMSQQR